VSWWVVDTNGILDGMAAGKFSESNGIHEFFTVVDIFVVDKP
jgi:hypothetical protein